MDISSRPTFRRSLLFILLFLGLLFAFGAASLFTVHAQTGDTGGLSSVTTIERNGESLLKYIINGPPHPSASFDVKSTIVTLPEPGQYSTLHALTVPAYSWVFGCSSVSGAMIAAFYDRTSFPNMYTGPTNSGVMPLDNSSWPTWSDGVTTYPNLPLAASHQGVDGRTTKGSIDDYWIQYGSSAQDPYITGSWTQHTWGDAIGDYMKTSQSAWGNSDGSSNFWNRNNATPLTCAEMVSLGHTDDGTLGRKQFYEARGYTVTTCYNQHTDNFVAGGFSLAQFKAEIDAGRPVMLNLFTSPYGHTVVGVGYDDASNTIYINDTWDYSIHAMTWGGSYGSPSMALSSVSIVNLQNPIPATHLLYLPLISKPVPTPGSFNKTAPANGAAGQSSSPTLSWGSSSGAAGYEYCIGTSACSAGSTWTSTTLNTSVPLSGLAVNTTYYWQVRANNPGGTTYADGGTGWSFTTGTAPAGCGLVNCDFEAGSSGWTEYSFQGWPLIFSSGDLPLSPHGGSYAAWLGGDNDEISYITTTGHYFRRCSLPCLLALD